ncbi:MAG: hypothetical protein HN742_10900 [Lentisphaerae bacterium]|nr:hypothetical protein [Lentisphaerota bacterium]MBT4818006.1 hypothetical protein [Lentisphaerota bacterium]MBT5607253.1 hypothetical protein [Lentisphaerota bacterium]MBT7058818.1 hypothetical protein [Lentisphaerota bacterium]MBT7842372.1 hypothetical protein [Lentisphaerota bacterium]
MPASQPNKKASDEKLAATEGRPRRIAQITLFVFSLLVFLSLLSHDSRDTDFLAGGMGSDEIIRNWIGYFGAWISRSLLLLFGFGSYLLATLLVLSSARRLFGRRGVRQILWDYWLSLGLVTIGTAMFCGIWPDLASELAAQLNVGQTPGGVVGQRFCAPNGGWMRIILNPTGSAIVSCALIAVGLGVVWLHDWHDLVLGGLTLPKMKRKTESPSAKEKKSAKTSAAERRSQKLREREELNRELQPVEEAPLPPPEEKPSKRKNKKKAQGTEDRTAGAKAQEQPTATPRHPAPAAYKLPEIDLLDQTQNAGTTADPKEVEAKKEILQETLDSFGIDAQVGNATSGPRVTLFEVLPAPGVKVERISQISNNIAMELRATSLRILTPIPGRNSVGIEVPNTSAALVTLLSLMKTREWQKSKARIPILLGRNISGGVVILDLAKAPHLLIAGATGSGKSVCINAIIMSMLYQFTPEELRLIMVDPKVVEFRAYESLPHLVVPVISETKKVPLALRWVINEMEKRYRILAKVGARNLEGFNSRPQSGTPELDDDGKPIPTKLPFIVVIIDELADVMMTAKADVETSLARIAQLSRAVGIHTIIATQRPSVNVITGTIKANFPTRIAFQVTSQVDSRTILDGKGAESLLGRGDMLFRSPSASGLERNQGALVDDMEIERVVEFCAGQGDQQFDEEVFKVSAGSSGDPSSAEGAGGGEAQDEELVQQAIEIIVRDRRATTSYLQRCMRIGYNRAASLIEVLEQRGVIGPQIGTAPREILILSNDDQSEDVDVDLPETEDGDVV